ncbi:MAG: hypothetical protein COX57_06570 [Alphaproteobacteria bacterium CG_4_10_14_0_2_um_filter_63_37]|nr:MAG: hypothetical protein AUJ55_09205 [Proteobacteria bacterium CG1_02_64_396]PJA24818.1 MAG: hypothetical protein COX57_06570 [Alphaproteobacteria bacterium CG_4_10_14_0_2_um_filter_63_37]
MIRTRLLAATLIALPAAALPLSALADPTGLEVMQQVDTRPDGSDLTQTIEQKLIDARGSVRERTMVSLRLDIGADKRQISFFLEPTNVRNTAMLTYDYDGAEKDDDQWLYLPALKKVRRIASGDRGDYFMGTDFTFEDIKQTPELADYTWKLLGSATVDGRDCWVVEGIPASADLVRDLGYSRSEHRVDKERLIALRVDYWDRTGKSLKVMRALEVAQIQGFWSIAHSEMENLQTGHKTEMTFSDQKYDTGLDEELFSERTLKRGWRQ